ncbi:unnamed protein product [Clonostachys solani]|uniref:Uncharacterized protein n=1 Tax=Clonostachys solani TaxID=160281 RepID=A0A9N9W7L7_9HYPO|nr:unnamed protein product [Clonostachys solani]
MDNQSLHLVPDIGQPIQLPYLNEGLLQVEPAFQEELMPCIQEPLQQPYAGLDLAAEAVVSMQDHYMNRFNQFTENKQRQEKLIAKLNQCHDRASEALATRIAANATMKDLLSEHNTLDPQCFTMRHAQAWKEVRQAAFYEADQYSFIKMMHESLEKITREGDDIVFQLKVLEVQIQKENPNFILFDYGQVGTEFEAKMEA